jgi:integrase
MARKRRGRNEGGVYQRGDGQWTSSISLGSDTNGKRKRKTVYGKTKKEVQDKLRDLQNRAAQGTLDNAGQMTAGQLFDHWLEKVARPTVSPTTYDRYEEHVRIHLKPHLGAIKLAKLNDLHVEHLYAEMERGGASASCRQKVGKALRQALRHAVARGLIAVNPALKVALPRVEKKEIRVYDQKQAGQFLKAARKDRFYALYVPALDSGMRQGELFGLQWPDIDFRTGSVHVQRSFENKGDQLRLKETKSKKGRRRINLSRFTLDALLEHRKKMLAGGMDVKTGQIFCDTQGGFLRKSNFRRMSFAPLLKASKLPPIRFHDLRHTCATLLLLRDVNVKVVSERLGHATVQLTLDVYSHVLPTLQERAAEKMDGLFEEMRPAEGEAGPEEGRPVTATA